MGVIICFWKVFMSKGTNLPGVLVSHVELLQQNFCHMFLTVVNICFVAFKDPREGSLSKTDLLRKHECRDNI